jgi:quercetin dioxygenase-like cupin family protein
MPAADPYATSALAANLAVNLRFLRQRRALTQTRLAAALQISLEELLSPPHVRCQLFPKGSLPQHTRGRDGLARVQKILPDPIPGMEIDRLELQPGARMAGVPHRPGTREYLACERGRLTLWAAGERFHLSPGDVAAFHGDQAHAYHNQGDVVAVGFSVVTLAPLAGVVPAPAATR